MLLAIALSTVLSIDMKWSSSYKGRTYGPVAVHIIRNGNAFVSNGAPVPGNAVKALIDALQAPAMSAPTPESLRVGGAALEALEPASMQECWGVSATQSAQDVYRRRFTDATAFASFLRSYYAKPPEPDTAIPTFRIIVTSSDVQITASSSSSKAGMLPFTIARGDATVTTYDASIPEAVGALLSSTASWSLRVDSLNREWATNICDDDMTDRALHDALPQTIMFAKEHGLVMHGSVRGDPLDSLTATLWKADNPRITLLYNADIRGGDVASVMALQSCSNVLHRIATIPWLRQVLASNPNATVSVDDPSMNGGFLEGAEVEELSHAGFGRAASLLASNLRLAPGFWVWLKPDKESTHWYLMPNGGALLVHYLPGEERLPLDPRTNALIHHRGKLVDGTPTITVGAVVTPAGALEP